MENTLYVSLSYQIGLRQLLDVTANNIANSNTDGFRADRVSFYELVETPENTEPISFSEPINITPNPEEGILKQTGNPLDFTIQGSGYFALNTPGETQYTRAGRFTLNLNNELISNHGYQVLDNSNQPITLPATYERIDITAEGLVVADGLSVGSIGVFDFNFPGDLEKTGDTLFHAVNPPVPRPDTILKQGYVEGSNVRAINELVKLIKVERDNQYVKNLIDQEDDISKKSITVFTQIS